MKRILSTATFYSCSIFLLIALIPIVQNDSFLALIYATGIAILLTIRAEKYDLTALIIGIIGVTISELFFVSTGVEKFMRVSLFGLIPLWLPLLWGYVFVTIKRVLNLCRTE